MEGGGLPSGLSLGDQGCEQVDLVAVALSQPFLVC